MHSDKKLAASLIGLLEEERTLLLKGDLAGLSGLLDRKQSLIEQLQANPEGDLSAVHDKLTRNHALLGSAMEGIRQVSERLEALKRTRLSLATYDRQGHRQTIDTTTSKRFEKRA